MAGRPSSELVSALAMMPPAAIDRTWPGGLGLARVAAVPPRAAPGAAPRVNGSLSAPAPTVVGPWGKPWKALPTPAAPQLSTSATLAASVGAARMPHAWRECSPTRSLRAQGLSASLCVPAHAARSAELSPKTSTPSTCLPQGCATSAALPTQILHHTGHGGASPSHPGVEGDADRRLGVLESVLAQFAAKVEALEAKESPGPGAATTDRSRGGGEAAPSLEESALRRLWQELRAESEGRRVAVARLERHLEAEARARDEALLREASRRDEAEVMMEQRWSTRLQEEAALLLAMVGSVEARLAATQREVRVELPTAAAESQKLSGALREVRDSLRRDADAQRADLAELGERVAELRARVEAREAALDPRSSAEPVGSSEGRTARPSEQGEAEAAAAHAEVQRRYTMM